MEPECDPHSARRVQEAGLCEQQRAFEFFDRDRDARVTVDDFTWAIEQLGLTGEGTVGLTKARHTTCYTVGTSVQQRRVLDARYRACAGHGSHLVWPR